MPYFFSISYFRKRLSALLGVKKKVYSGVTEEINSVFSGVSMSQILSNRDMILIENDLVVVKLRVPDRKQHLSKSNGYRLIYMAFKETEKVIFLDIYPKRGPLQQINISDIDLLNMIKIYNTEALDGSLESYPIN